MTATLEQMYYNMKIRYNYFQEILTNLSESELNTQLIEGRRSIAEIMVHIFRSDTAPMSVRKLFYNFINIFNGLVRKANKEPVDASNYIWNVERG